MWYLVNENDYGQIEEYGSQPDSVTVASFADECGLEAGDRVEVLRVMAVYEVFTRPTAEMRRSTSLNELGDLTWT